MRTENIPIEPLNPNLSAELNRGIVQSEIDGGVYLSSLAPGDRLELETQNHLYSVVNLGGDAQGRNRVRISGHPEFCPEPIEVTVYGSNWGGSLLKPGFVGRGMRLEFRHPIRDLVTTSRILEIRQLEPNPEMP